MSVAGLMRHTVNLYRPAYDDTETAQGIGGYSLVRSGIPAFVQPADSQTAFFYAQRGLEATHVVYTSDVSTEFKREDILDFGGRQLHVLGVLSGLELDVYQQMTCEEYPEGAKKRLDRGAY